jgi:hypothetical protein
LLIAITDNKIDFAAMDPAAAKALNEVLHNPETLAQFGIGPMSQKFDPEQCKRLYQAIGKLLHTGARAGLHWPERAAAALEYTAGEQEELAKPTAAVLDELAPRWLQQNQSVVALLVVFGAITQHKISQAVMILREESAANARADDAMPSKMDAKSTAAARKIG